MAYATKVGLEEGRERGLKEGREKGMAEGRAEVVRKMLEAGLSKEYVCEILGISMEDFPLK